MGHIIVVAMRWCGGVQKNNEKRRGKVDVAILGFEKKRTKHESPHCFLTISNLNEGIDSIYLFSISGK